MSELIRNAILAAFVELLNTTPLDHITVNSVAQKSGINRRTFYHYFHDIYQLPEVLFLAQTKATLAQPVCEDFFEAGLLRLLSFAAQHKNAVWHIYDSSSREHLERYIYGAVEKNVRTYLESKTQGGAYDAEKLDWVAAFYTSAIVGMSMEWISRGMQEDPKGAVASLNQTMHGTLEVALRNCRSEHAQSTPATRQEGNYAGTDGNY